MHDINGLFYIDYEIAEKNYFRGVDAVEKAVGFLAEQLNGLSEEEIFSEGFCWSGSECIVNIGCVSSVVGRLYSMGLDKCVIIIPYLCGELQYILKPYSYNAEYPVKLGIAITSELGAKGKCSSKRVRSIEKVLDTLYNKLIAGIDDASIVKKLGCSNDILGEIELRYYIHCKSDEDLTKFKELLDEFVKDLRCKHILSMNCYSVESDNDFVGINSISWNPMDAYGDWLVECDVVREIAPLLELDFSSSDFDADLNILYEVVS